MRNKSKYFNQPLQAIFLIKICLIFIFSLFPNQSFSQTKTDPNTISLPWETFKELWIEAQDEPIKRSREFAYGKVILFGKTLPMENDQYYLIQFKANLDIQTFGKGKKIVPFLSSKLDFEDISLNDKPVTWTEKDGYLQVILNDSGIHRLVTTFSIKVDKSNWPRSINLPLVPHARTEIILRVPEKNIVASFNPGVSLTPVMIDEQSQIRGYIPATSTVNIKWSNSEDKINFTQAQIKSEINTIINFGNQSARGISLVDFDILKGETNNFEIIIPDDLEILDIQSLNPDNEIAQWFVEKNTDQRSLKIISKFDQDSKFRLKIIFEKTLTEGNTSYQAPVLKPKESLETSQTLALSHQTNIKIEEIDTSNTSSLDYSLIKQELKNLAEGKINYLYQLKESSRLEFKIKSNKLANSINDKIKKMEVVSSINESGTVVSKINYIFEHNQSQFLKLTTPLKGRILASLVNQKKVIPGINQKGEILIPLIKSNDQSFKVEIIYKSTNTSYKLWGENNLQLPSTNLMVGELNWDLYLPENIQPIYYLSRLQPENNFNHFKKLIGIDSLLANNYYLDDQDQNPSIRKLFENTNTPSTNEPIETYLPTTSKKVSLSSYLVENSLLNFKFYYLNQTIAKMIGYFYGLLSFILVFWFLGIVFERANLGARLSKLSRFILFSFLTIPLYLLLLIIQLDIALIIINFISISFGLFYIFKTRLTIHRIESHTFDKTRFYPLILTGVFFISLVISIILESYFILIPISVILIIITIVLEKLALKKSGFIETSHHQDDATVFFSLIFLILFSFTNYTHAIEIEEIPKENIQKISDGHVFLNWEIVEELLEKIEKKKQLRSNQLGIDYSFGTPNISGDINTQFAEIQIKIPIKLLNEKYIQIPLVPNYIAIIEAKINGKNVTINKGEEYTYLEVLKTNDDLLDLELNLILPIRSLNNFLEFTLESPLIRGAQVKLAHDKEIKSIYIHDVSWQQKEDTSIEASMGNLSTLKVELSLFDHQLIKDKKNSPKFKKLYSETFTLSSITENHIDYYSLIRFMIFNQTPTEFKFTLPNSILVDEIKGNQIENWEKTSTEEGKFLYTIKTKNNSVENFDIALHYQQTLKDQQNEFIIPNLEILDAARNTGYIGIEAIKNSTIKLTQLINATQIDIQNIPQIIQYDTKSPLIYGFRYTDQNHEIIFHQNNHQEYPIEEININQAVFSYLMDKDRILINAKLTIHNQSKKSLNISLPDHHLLSSAFINHESFNLASSEENQISLPLITGSQNIELNYQTPLESLNDWFNVIDFNFPLIDASISNLKTVIYLPDHFSIYNLTDHFKITDKNKNLSLKDSKQELIDQLKSSNQFQTNEEFIIPENYQAHYLSKYFTNAHQIIHLEVISYHQAINTITKIFLLLMIILCGYLSKSFFEFGVFKKTMMIVWVGLSIIFYSEAIILILFFFLIGLGISYLVNYLKNKKMLKDDNLNFDF